MFLWGQCCLVDFVINLWFLLYDESNYVGHLMILFLFNFKLIDIIFTHQFLLFCYLILKFVFKYESKT